MSRGFEAAESAKRIRGTESAKVHPDYNVVEKTIYSVTNPTLDQMQTLELGDGRLRELVEQQG